MALQIIDYGHRYRAIVAVAHDGKDRLFSPFDCRPVTHAVEVGQGRVVCLAQDGAVCLYDSGTDSIRARARSMNGFADLLVTRDGKLVILYARYLLHALRVDDLATVIEADAMRWLWGGHKGSLVDTGVHTTSRGQQELAGRSRRLPNDASLLFYGAMVEDAAGRFAVQFYDGEEGRKRYGLYRIDRGDWTMRLELFEEGYDYPVLNELRWFSPSGRFGVRRHLGTLAMDSGAPARTGLLAFGKRRAPRHRDALSDGVRRFGLALEIWSLDPLALHTVVVTRMDALRCTHPALQQQAEDQHRGLTMMADLTRGRPAAPGLPFPDPATLDPERRRSFDALTRLLADFLKRIRQVVWEPDERAFWVLYSGNNLRRVCLDGALSPLFIFRRWAKSDDPLRSSIRFGYPTIDFPTRNRVRVGGSPHGFVSVGRSWCASDVPLIMVPEDKDAFEPFEQRQPTGKVLRRFIQDHACHRVTLPDFSTEAVRPALRLLTRDVRERLSALIRSEVFETVFLVGGERITEVDFFARIAREGLPVVPELRELLEAFLAIHDQVLREKRISEQLWGPDDMGALGPAMIALLRLDPSGARDIFRVYLRKRDGEHEVYTTNQIMKDYVAAIGWTNEAMIRFGAYFAIVRYADGCAGRIWNEYGLLDAAKRMLDADAFAQMVVTEAEGYPLPGRWDHESVDGIYASLASELPMLGEFGTAVMTALERLARRRTSA